MGAGEGEGVELGLICKTRNNFLNKNIKIKRHLRTLAQFQGVGDSEREISLKISLKRGETVAAETELSFFNHLSCPGRSDTRGTL